MQLLTTMLALTFKQSQAMSYAIRNDLLGWGGGRGGVGWDSPESTDLQYHHQEQSQAGEWSSSPCYIACVGACCPSADDGMMPTLEPLDEVMMPTWGPIDPIDGLTLLGDNETHAESC